MLLWNFCNRFRTPSEDEERAEQANEAFLEAQAIEDSLNIHTCNLDTTLIYTTREYVHKYVTALSPSALVSDSVTIVPECSSLKPCEVSMVSIMGRRHRGPSSDASKRRIGSSTKIRSSSVLIL